jgi:hypothetical protein
MRRLAAAMQDIRWASELSKELAISTALRLLITRSYERLEQITEADLKSLPRDRSKGTDLLDAGLCALGVFQRSLLRGANPRLADNTKGGETAVLVEVAHAEAGNLGPPKSGLQSGGKNGPVAQSCDGVLGWGLEQLSRLGF